MPETTPDAGRLGGHSDYAPGDRVLVYGSWQGTVVRSTRGWLSHVDVLMDHDQGTVAVDPTYVQSLN